MKTWEKIAIVAFALLVLLGVGIALVAPTVLREVRRVSAPMQRMKRSQTALEDLTRKTAWKPPEKDTLSAEQLGRFFAVRRRIDELRREPGFDLGRLEHRHARTLEELKEVPGVIEGVSGVVSGEMNAYVEAGMPPREYHWIERLVYERWRGPLRRAGTYPLAARQAAAEIDGAAAREADPRLRARLRGVAEELRRRAPAPPEGFDPQIHALLLSRMDEIERWSMDDLAGRPFPQVR